MALNSKSSPPGKMLIVKSLSDIPSLPQPCSLTIGSFDGVHLGHVRLLKRLRETATNKGTTAVLTFRDHPSKILKTKAPACLIASLDHKLKLFKELGIDLVLLLDFTPELAELSYDHFLTKIKDVYPFSFLILGEGAFFGKARQGTEENVRLWEQRLNFHAEYLPKATHLGEPISSSRIRDCIAQGDLATVSALLGRPYSLYGTFFSEEKDPARIVMPLDGVCLLPEGSYRCLVKTPNEDLLLEGSITHFPPKISLPLGEISSSLEVIFL